MVAEGPVLLLGAEEHGRSSGYTSARHGPYRHGGTEGITGSGSLLLVVLLFLWLYLREPSAAAPGWRGREGGASGCWLYDETPADEEAWKIEKSAGEAVEAPWPRHMQHDARPGAPLAYRGLTCRRVWRGGQVAGTGWEYRVRSTRAYACADESTRCSWTSTDSHSIGVEPDPRQRPKAVLKVGKKQNDGKKTGRPAVTATKNGPKRQPAEARRARRASRLSQSSRRR